VGQSLFEVIVAIGVIAAVIVGVVVLATNSIRNTTFTRNNSLATRYAQEAIEWLRGERDADWATFRANAGVSGNKYCLDALNWTKPQACNATEVISDTILTRSVTFSNILATQVNANVTVSWNDSQGAHQVATSTVYTDWRSR